MNGCYVSVFNYSSTINQEILIMMFKRLFTILLFCILYITTYAQKTISGSVNDQGTNAGIPGAVVYIPEFQRSTTTDGSGKYTFDNVGNGVINIQVTSIGYKSKVEIITFSDGSITHDFSLEPSA